MKKVLLSTLLLVAALSFTYAQDGNPRHDKMKEKFEKLTPEQRAVFEQKMADRKAKFDAMTPEQQAAFKQKMTDRKAKWEALTPEQRQAAIANRKNHKHG